MSLRTLKIQTGVVKRIHQERKSYFIERDQQQKRIDKLIADGADSHDISKQREVLDETLQMIPDCKSRLEKAQQKLQELINNQDSSWAGTNELKEAEEILRETLEDK